MSEASGPSPTALLDALGLALLIVDDAAADPVTPASVAGAAFLAEADVRTAALEVAARAKRDQAVVARAAASGDRLLNLEARPLDPGKVLVSIVETADARRRREWIALAEEEAARELVASALEPLVRDRASEALAAIRGAEAALEDAAAAGRAGLDDVASAHRDAEGLLRALLAAVRRGESAEAGARAAFDLEASVAAVVERQRAAFKGVGVLRHANGAPRWALADASLIERAIGLLLEWIARRLDPVHALDNQVTLVLGEAQGRPHLEALIVGHLVPERPVPAEDLLRRAFGSGSMGFLAARALAAAGGGELARVTDPSGHLAYRLALSPAVAVNTKVELRPRRARVLAIDDEPMLVTAYQRMMRKTHDIVPIVGGEAALELLRTDRAFDVILCDLVMPMVSGIDVYRSVEQTYPELAKRFIFLSGGAYTPSARAFLEASGARCLDKPVEVPTLVAIISEALAARDG